MVHGYEGVRDIGGWGEKRPLTRVENAGSHRVGSWRKEGGQGGRREGLRTPLSGGLEHWNEVRKNENVVTGIMETWDYGIKYDHDICAVNSWK